jgi:hypothetical protein
MDVCSSHPLWPALLQLCAVCLFKTIAPKYHHILAQGEVYGDAVDHAGRVFSCLYGSLKLPWSGGVGDRNARVGLTGGLWMTQSHGVVVDDVVLERPCSRVSTDVSFVLVSHIVYYECILTIWLLCKHSDGMGSLRRGQLAAGLASSGVAAISTLPPLNTKLSSRSSSNMQHFEKH